MFSNCSGPCETCYIYRKGITCLAGNGDDDYMHVHDDERRYLALCEKFNEASQYTPDGYVDCYGIHAKELEKRVLKDSGERSQFVTGAQRDCSVGKGRMDLLPYRALIALSKLYEAGAIKYDERNWEKGIPLERFMDSGFRHFAKFITGQRDEPHLVQTCWNMLCALDTLLRIQEGELPNELISKMPYNETIFDHLIPGEQNEPPQSDDNL